MTSAAVALDCRWMQDVRRGGVARSLANTLPLLTSAVDVHVLCDARRPRLDLDLPTTYLRAGLRSSTVWLQGPATRWLRHFPGIFHTPWYGLPFRQPVPMVVTIHDIVFETHPEWYPQGREWPYRVQARWAARTARAILTPSETVRGEIIDRYPVDPQQVTVAPHGIDPIFSPDVDPEPRARLLGTQSIPRYVVALGGAARRQLDVAVAAWRMLRRAGHDYWLVTVGGGPPPAEAGLVHLSNPSDPDWASLLAGADALVYPTLYEGFGMPATEAIAAGTPVVCARSGALPEVLGDCAQWASRAVADDIGNQLIDLIERPARHAELRQAGLDRARTMTWDRAAEVTIQAYRAAAG